MALQANHESERVQTHRVATRHHQMEAKNLQSTFVWSAAAALSLSLSDTHWIFFAGRGESFVCALLLYMERTRLSGWLAGSMTVVQAAWTIRRGRVSPWVVSFSKPHSTDEKATYASGGAK